jgi:hypothetical protein
MACASFQGSNVFATQKVSTRKVETFLQRASGGTRTRDNLLPFYLQRVNWPSELADQPV